MKEKVCKNTVGVKYKYAKEFAQQIEIFEGCRYFAFINGTFIFGDFIEALIVENNYHVKELTISTLSMSYENVDSLANLINGDFVEKLNLMISDYQFSHEKGSLIPYLYQELDKDNKFQLATASVHTKITLIETYCGKKIVIHGSANLRTSANIEQICVEENTDLFDFNYRFHESLFETFKTINKEAKNIYKSKSVRGDKAWHQEAVATKE